jgi:MoaD family protein
MQVSVRFFTILREITAKKEETLQFVEGEKVTIGVVLEKLAAHYGKPFADYVFDSQSGAVRGYLQFFVNGQSASALKRLETELHNGDLVAIVPPVGGG